MTQLQTAVQAYKNAEQITQRSERLAGFRKAELLFRQLVSGDANPNPDLFVNLGNAALRADHLGQAVLAYRNALHIDPDHRRAEQNLRYARSLLPDWVPRPDPQTAVGSMFGWLGRRTRAELFGYAGGAFLLAALFVAGGIRFRRSELRNLAFVPGAAWLLLLIASFSSASSPSWAVVTVVEVEAKSSDSPNAPNRLPQALPAGAEVLVQEHRLDWVKVTLADGRDAWLPKESITTIDGRMTDG